MRRRIQRKPIRSLQREVVNKKEQVPISAINIREVVGVISSLGGLVGALLWIAGRYYTAAYFEAMNIPFSQINYSVWEYAGVAGPKLFYIVLAKSYFPLSILATALGIVLLITFTLQRLLPQLRLLDAMRALPLALARLPRNIRNLIVIALILYLVYFLMQATIEFSDSGLQEGKQTVLTRSYAVEVYSTTGIPLGMTQTPRRNEDGLYHYPDLWLLTHNNGKYYLFREIDRETCRPEQVFVVPDTEAIYVVVEQRTPVRPTCTAEIRP
jgi:hypothetical protein